MSTNIPKDRRTSFQLGTVLTVIGGFMFASFFVAVAIGISGSRIESAMPTVIGITMGGFALMFIGQMLRTVGQKGLAGSGLSLDPAQARRDLEPWSRMTGGMVSDALDEAGVNIHGQSQPMPFD